VVGVITAPLGWHLIDVEAHISAKSGDGDHPQSLVGGAVITPTTSKIANVYWVVLTFDLIIFYTV